MTMYYDPNPMMDGAARARAAKACEAYRQQSTVDLVKCSDGNYREPEAAKCFERAFKAQEAVLGPLPKLLGS